MCAQRGFLLLEIMIALLFFATVSLVIAHYCASMAYFNEQAHMYCKATDIARDIFETIIQNKVIQSDLPGTIDSFEVDLKSTLLMINFHRVELKLSWGVNKKKQQTLTFNSCFFIQDNGGTA